MARVSTAPKEQAQRSIHALSPGDVYAQVRSGPGGLTQSEAEARLRVYGANRILRIKGRPIWMRFLANFTHMMALLLWTGGIIALAAGMTQLAVAIWMVNVINGVFSFWQEYRAERATEALRRVLPAYARVLRDGEERPILAEELVQGDVILLGEGDRISADARLVQVSDLRVDESTLTGESHPVHKRADAVVGPALPSVLPNLVYAGTVVVAGSGKALVFATGMGTRLGGIAGLTQSVREELSPLQRELLFVTRIIALLATGIGALFFVLAVVLAGVSLADGFILALGMVVAFVPEGLLPTVTLSLAIGVQRMARRNALIKKLSSVETLGCTTTICTDKTGTLTENEMTVRSLWVGGRQLEVTGAGYGPEGRILDGGRPVAGSLGDDLRHILETAVLCNNARLMPPNSESPRWTVLGDPTEAALIVAAIKGGIDPQEDNRHNPRLRELPFDSRRKRMSTIHSMGEERVACVKGAPKETLALCDRVRIEGEELPLDGALRESIVAANDQYARDGLRVLAVARRVLPAELQDYRPETVEEGLAFLGLVAMMDPPRPEVTAAVERCRTAGIRIIMMTGDYGLTAESIARRIGILRRSQVRIVTGDELESMAEFALREALAGEVIFARVSPEHKLRVVQALQEMGQVVAVTGDGVNDAPALKKADIGVAMGLTGTDVAKEAATMVLADDNFASIVNAIEEGRAVYANIKKFITYIFTSNTPEAVPFILFALSGSRIPLALRVMHILSIDLGTDLLPALALGAEPPEAGIMNMPPRRLREHVITPGLLLRAYGFLGPIQSLAAMTAFYLQYWISGYWGHWLDLPSTGPLYRSATAMALAAVVTTQVGNLFAQRTEKASVFTLSPVNNLLIWIGVGSQLTLIWLIVYAPGLQTLIGTEGFRLQNWAFLLALAPLLLLLDELRKWLLRKREGRR